MNPLPDVDQRSAWSKRQVIVVDEDLERCHHLRDLLSRHGLAVDVARTAAQALAALAGHKPCLMLSLAWLPDASGEELARRVYALDPALPVILLGSPSSASPSPVCSHVEPDLSDDLLLREVDRRLAVGCARPAKPLTVLLVEDEPRVNKLLRDYLQLQGFRVQTAGSGEEALEALEGCRLLAIVLDLLLPGMDGIAALRQIRSRHPDVPVIIASQVDDEDKRQEALSLGINDYLIKPLDFEHLTGMLIGLLQLDADGRAGNNRAGG